jgi:asparagine synthase (glutamine-hydrolysing)
MCGLWAYILRNGPNFTEEDYDVHMQWANACASRGPDRYCEIRGLRYHMMFHRLAIHDMSLSGDQPFFHKDRYGTSFHVMCNGEIYNYQQIMEKHKFEVTSKSDCEVILHLLIKYRNNVAKVLEEIQGEFSFVAFIQTANGRERIITARDPFGVRPLYYAHTKNGILFSSTLSGIAGFNAPFEKVVGDHMPPGTWMEINDRSVELHTYYDVRARVVKNSDMTLEDYEQRVTSALINSVARRLDSDRPIGFLLSGGLDSSLVVGIATKVLNKDNVHTYSIGMKDSPDVAYAQMVADHCGTKHTVVSFEAKDGFSVIDDVVKATETFDITTIRASTPQYLLARYISKNTDIKVVLNGDGADEVEAGYMYFHQAPSHEEMHDECLSLLRDIHKYDGLRVDRTLGAHGLEARLPFLDPEFVEAYLSVPSEYRMPDRKNGRKEKQFLRDAFAKLYPDVLPECVLQRTKDAFSDGVSQNKKGMNWFEQLQGFANEVMSESHVERMQKLTHLPPSTSESAYYRDVFEQNFEGHATILKRMWLPKWTTATDPSARTLEVYDV